MPRRLRLCPLALCLAVVLSLSPHAQMRVVPLDDEQGHVALGLVLRHLANTGVLMMATAHPDDENNGLLVQANRGLGYRTALVTATRGNGGQNEIGPELFEALGVLRTQELAALHRFDGAEQYFTRAVDFGYSFSIDETLEKWGKDEITGDFVRLIRTIRPDVITAMRPDGTGGGLHHQTSARLAREAYLEAGDPTKYPAQIKDGLRPWQPKKFYFMGLFGYPGEPPLEAGARVVPIDLTTYDPLLGKTYAEIGIEARSMHKCQGMAPVLALPGPATTTYQLVECAIPGGMIRDEKSIFDGVDSSIAALARFAGPKPPRELTDGLSAIASAVQSAQRKFDTDTEVSTVPPLVTGLRATRVMRAGLRSLPIDDSARYEIDFRLRQKEREFQQAIVVANGITIDALAGDGVVVPGQPVKLSLVVANHGADVTVKQVRFSGFDGDGTCALHASRGMFFLGGGPGPGQGPAEVGPAVSTVTKDMVVRCDPSMTVPVDARITEPYWHRQGQAGRYTFDADAPFGLPFRPTPFYAQVTLVLGGEDVIDGLPVQYRYPGSLESGEKRSDLLVVPALSVRVSPEIAIVPAGELRALSAAKPAAGSGLKRRTAAKSAPVAASGREIRVTVVNDAPGPADSVVKLDVPSGWTAMPASQAVTFMRQDESQTVRFTVRPGPAAAPGEYHVKALASSGGRTFDRGYEVIEYPHIRRQHIYNPADITLKVIDVRTAPHLSVGYIMGAGDQVPPAIEQLGATVEMLDADDLAWGNLSRFDAIVAGVRAYERRDDLRANNSRLLEYVRNGGTLIVQYNRPGFNQAGFGPYPVKVGSERVTDETSPVVVLAPNDPLMTFPNRITSAAWNGWAQERGLNFLSEKDARYRDVVQLEDPFPNNQGAKLGSLVEATYGKGHWVYVGLNLWRQLPAGTDGAYQILANLISLGKAPAERRGP